VERKERDRRLDSLPWFRAQAHYFKSCSVNFLSQLVNSYIWRRAHKNGTATLLHQMIHDGGWRDRFACSGWALDQWQRTLHCVFNSIHLHNYYASDKSQILKWCQGQGHWASLFAKRGVSRECSQVLSYKCRVVSQGCWRDLLVGRADSLRVGIVRTPKNRNSRPQKYQQGQIWIARYSLRGWHGAM
jgi:hypothetical protein